MNYKKGDIVIVKFPFILNQRTEKQKGRPALVISNEKVERRYKDLLLAAITSNIPMDITELEMILEPVISTGLVKRSLLRLDSYAIKSENLSLTLENKRCHAELGSASRFVQRVRS